MLTSNDGSIGDYFNTSNKNAQSHLEDAKLTGFGFIADLAAQK